LKLSKYVAPVLTLVLLLGAGGSAAAATPGQPGPRSWNQRIGAAPQPKLAPDAVAPAEPAAGSPIAAIRPIYAGSDAGGRRSVVVEGNDPAALARVVEENGGEVVTSAPGAVRAQVPADRLDAVAGDSAVRYVRAAHRLDADMTSEGVASPGASTWQGGGTDGTGVKVGIVDIGFQGYVAKLGTELPASVTTQNFCGAGSTGFDGSGPSGTDPPSPHGAATAEIVHDMAPGAALYLVCVYDSTDFIQAEQYLVAQGVTIVNASIGSAVDGRGDGGSGYSSAAVKAGREAGQLWTVSAGNLAQNHFAANLRDVDGDTAMEMFPGGLTYGFVDAAEEYTYGVLSGNVSLIQMKWDAWPSTTGDYDIHVFVDQVDQAHELPCDFGGCQDQSSGGGAPVEQIAFLNDDNVAHTFFLIISNYNGAAPARADLYFMGQEYNPKSIDPTGSLANPAASPFVMTVGAACYAGSSLELFSSQGPTIDGRIKPDITGPDRTSSSVYGPTNGCASASGFAGTSAAAPHVAGAAALIKQANPALDTSKIQAVLEKRAQDVGATGKDNGYGAGLLKLGATGPPQPPTPMPFTGVTPVRVMDTRKGQAPVTNGDNPIGPGGSIVQGFAGQNFGGTVVPANATAVVLNVTSVNATTGGWFTIWPLGAPIPTASSLNFAPGQIVANWVHATLGQFGGVNFSNALGPPDSIVDLVGWYAPAASSGLVAVNPPVRALDSRSNGGPIGPGGIRQVQLRNTTIQGTPIPANATAVALNVTAVQPTASGYFTVWPHGSAKPTASSLNFTPGAIVPNLVVATIGTLDSVDFFNSNGNTNIVIDVLGYYVPGAGNGYVPLPAPTRDLDTRTGNGPRLGSLQGGFPFDLDVGGMYGVPYDAPAVLLNVTVNAPNGSGFLTVFPTGSPSSTSNLNFSAGQTVPNAVIASLGTAGRATFYVQATVPFTPTISDLQGYFSPLA
jgi:hypothetical protein